MYCPGSIDWAMMKVSSHIQKLTPQEAYHSYEPTMNWPETRYNLGLRLCSGDQVAGWEMWDITQSLRRMQNLHTINQADHESRITDYGSRIMLELHLTDPETLCYIFMSSTIMHEISIFRSGWFTIRITLPILETSPYKREKAVFPLVKGVRGIFQRVFIECYLDSNGKWIIPSDR